MSMRKILTYLLAIMLCVACEAAYEPDQAPTDPKPVRPIKPRPIVPDGTILRPRVIGLVGIIARPDLYEHANRYRMVVTTTQGEVLYDGVCEISDSCLELPDVDYCGEMVFTLDNGSEIYSFSLPAVVK